MSVFSFPCSHAINITQTSTFGYLNPPSKASGIAVALFQHILYKNSVSSRRVIHQHMGHGPTNFPFCKIGLPLTFVSSKEQQFSANHYWNHFNHFGKMVNFTTFVPPYSPIPVIVTFATPIFTLLSQLKI